MKNRKQKLLALFLTLVMVMGILPQGMFWSSTTAMAGVAGPDNWRNHTDTSWYDGTATSYIIADAADLAGLAGLVNAGNTFVGITIALTSDIDFSAYEWTTIGKNSAPFNGEFIGNGHNLTGLFFGTVSTPTYINNNIGLFGSVGATGKITNLNVSLNCTNVTGTLDVGIMAGANSGRIEDCTASGSISLPAYVATPIAANFVGRNSSTGTIINCTSSGTCSVSVYVNPSNMGYISGFTALNLGQITQCSSNVDFSGSGNLMIGGFVSFNEGQITQCTSSGDQYAEKASAWIYGGGFVGINQATGSITNSGSNGNITVSNTFIKAYNVGGFAGYNRGIVSNCYATGNSYDTVPATPYTNIGSFMGYQASGSTINCYSSGNVVTNGYSITARGFAYMVAGGEILNNYYDNKESTLINYFTTDPSVYKVTDLTKTTMTATSNPTVVSGGSITYYTSYTNSTTCVTGSAITLVDALNAGRTVSGAIANYNSWSQDATVNDGYPFINYATDNISIANNSLQMSAVFIPHIVVDKRVTWSVANGTGNATIDQNGLLTPQKGGTVSVSVVAMNESNKSATLQVTIPPVEITSFNGISNVSAGTAGAATYANASAVSVSLPATVTANSGTITVPTTTWIDTDHYNPAIAGSYTFTAALGSIPSGYSNTGNYTAVVEVVVSSAISNTTSPSNTASAPAPTNSPASLPLTQTMTIVDKEGNLNVGFTYTQENSSDAIETLAIPVTTEILAQIKSDGVKTLEFTITAPDRFFPTDTTAETTTEQSSRLILPSELLTAAKEAGKDISIAVTDQTGKERYSWTFSSEELNQSGKEMTEVILSLEVSSITNNSLLMEYSADTKGLLLSFSHDGILPATATLKIYVGDQQDIKPGDKIYLYHYNEETKKLDILPNSENYVVDKDGYIQFQIVHCSDYIALSLEANANQLTSLSEQITVTPPKQTLYIGGTKGKTKTIQVMLPATLVKVSKISDVTSSGAIEGVTISFTSNNSKVATVSQSGKIVAKKTGKAVITTTLILANGETTEVKTTVTVKNPFIKIISSDSSMKDGQTFTFKATAYGLDTAKIKWITTENSIIEISKTAGVATAKSKGTDYVVASIGDVTKKVMVVVK